VGGWRRLHNEQLHNLCASAILLGWSNQGRWDGWDIQHTLEWWEIHKKFGW